MASFIDHTGARQQVEVSLDNLIKPAKEANLSVRDYANQAYSTDASKYGDAFSQLCASEGIVLQGSRPYGIKAPSLDAVLNGRPTIEANAIVRTPTSQARVLLMPAIGALVEDKLLADLDMNANAFDSMIAMDTVIADEWYLWPEANFAGPEAGRSQITSQLAKPVNMLSLTTSEKSLRVPTYSLGIEWSEQATKYLSLDFISLSIARQMAVERNERANKDLLAMLSGDADVGQGALSGIANKVKTASGLDAAATAGITQLAWMLWLYNNGKKRRITHVVTDITGALAIQNRSGRPVITGDNGTSTRINTNESVMNPTWGDDVQVFITDDASWPAKTIMGIDARFAIQRVTSTNASYQAQEDFVLRRASAMRFDYGSVSRRLYNDAFEVLTFA
jgi:hypothetical protein